MFFEFARMMVWSDGNYDAQEREIMQRLLGAHMERLDVEGLSHAMHESRKKAEASHMQDDIYLEEQAQKKVGIGPLIAQVFAGGKDLRLKREVPESRFYMWRTIFAMVHADHEVTAEERKFVYNILNNENFSDEQRRILEQDIENPQDISEMFMQISDQQDRSRFFYYARMLCWCDGNFDEQEQEIMLKLKKLHVRNVDFLKIDTVDMELDEEQKVSLQQDMQSDNPIVRFFRRFGGR